MADRAGRLRERLADFDRRVDEASGADLVVTHGEPHPGNLVMVEDSPVLVDWDTVGLAPPERDLWLVADGPDDLARYGGAPPGGGPTRRSWSSFACAGPSRTWPSTSRESALAP